MESNTEDFNLDNWDDDSYDPFIEQFWKHVVEYAAELNLPIKYVEEEFVIDGELIKE